MSHLTVPQILKLHWEDADLSGVRWEEGGRDLVLTFQRNDSHIELRCSWAESLKLDLENHNNRGGQFLTRSGIIEPQPDERYRVHFDFGSPGQVSLICNQVVAVLSDYPRPTFPEAGQTEIGEQPPQVADDERRPTSR